MTTKLRRLVALVPPEHEALVRHVARLRGTSVASTVAELVAAAVPGLEHAARLLELVARADAQGRAMVLDALETGGRALEVDVARAETAYAGLLEGLEAATEAEGRSVRESA